MATVKRVKEVPVESKQPTETKEVELDENDPEIVHERFLEAHEKSDGPSFIAAALRKVAQHLHAGFALPRAFERAAEDIETLVSEGRESLGSKRAGRKVEPKFYDVPGSDKALLTRDEIAGSPNPVYREDGTEVSREDALRELERFSAPKGQRS